MKAIQYRSTLMYYDGPQVIEAVDGDGHLYVGVNISPALKYNLFFVVEVLETKLRQFINGDVDLRSLLLDRGDEEWFLAKDDGDIGKPMEIALQASSLLASGFLPGDGIFLSKGD